jgi:hypothetical protein
MRTNCIVKLSTLKIFELNKLVQKETSGHVEENLLLRTAIVAAMYNVLKNLNSNTIYANKAIV